MTGDLAQQDRRWTTFSRRRRALSVCTMNQFDNPALAARILLAVIAAWTVWAVIDLLEPVGRHFLGLGALRIAMLATLFAFAIVAGARDRRLGNVGLAIASFAAVLNVSGAIGSVAMDGWSYNPFDDSGPEAAPPWYTYAIGSSALLFALASSLVGIAGRGHRLSVPVILAGVLYVPAVALSQSSPLAGHLIWVAPWLFVALGLAPVREWGLRAGVLTARRGR